MSDHQTADYQAEAKRVRQAAEKANDPESKAALLEIAERYDRLAARTSRR
jgi:hypothetical protein